MLTEKSGGPVETLISSWPIYLADIATAEKASDYSFIFQMYLPKRGWFPITIKAGVMVTREGAAEMANAGAVIHDYGLFTQFARASADVFYASKGTSTRFDQYGWKNGGTAFLLGRNLYTAQGVFAVSGSKEVETRNQWIGAGCNSKNDPKFGLERWRKAASSLFTLGCEAQSVAVLAGFAAPLMCFLSKDEGGAILALVTRESGTGKTTGLAGACSIWGDRHGLSLTNDDNRVAKFLTLASLGNLPVVYDEIATRDPLILREFVIAFTNGRDKQRGSRDGDRVIHSGTWQTICITASNASLVETLSHTDKADAPAMRVLEIPFEIPPGLSVLYGDSLKQELIANAGYAGDEYIKYIIQPAIIDWIKDSLARTQADVWARTRLKHDARFWVRTITAIAVAGAIVRYLGLLEFDPDRIVQWLIDRVAVSEREVSAEERKRGAWYVAAMTDFISKESANILVLPKSWAGGASVMAPQHEPRGEIKGTMIISEKKLIVSTNTLRKYAIDNEIPYKEWQALMQKDGICTEPVRRTLTAGTTLAGAQIMCIEIDLLHPAMVESRPAGLPTNVVPLRPSTTPRSPPPAAER